MATWECLLKKAFEEHGDDFSAKIIFPPEIKLHVNTKKAESIRFTAWGGKGVYFPASLYSVQWVEYVPRHPCNMALTSQEGTIELKEASASFPWEGDDVP